MVSQLTELPEAVVSLIFGHLVDSPRALQQASLVSHACYEAAAPFLYRKLPMQISSRQKIADDVKTLKAASARTRLLSHVRCLKLWGRMPVADEDTSFDPAELAEELGSSEEYDAEFGGVFVRDLPDGPPEDIAEAWAPLASLIERCMHLTDLVWVCWNQLPPCVLAAIHKSHPACRLHMRSFRLRSLAAAVTDPHELDLIRSPCLYSISVKTVIKDSDGRFDYNGDAIFQVAALAPNLKHVNIVSPSTGSSAALLQSRNAIKEPWKGFVPPLEIKAKGSLTSLSYSGKRGISVKDIEEWQDSIDMSQIRDLILGEVSDPLIFRSLRTNINSASLNSLNFTLIPSSTDGIDSLVSEVTSLLAHLESLTAFALSGYLAPVILDQILHQHGPQLRRLTLNPQRTYGTNIESPRPVIAAMQISAIQAHCPVLEYLSIRIPSTRHVFADICPKLDLLHELELNIGVSMSDLLTEKAGRDMWSMIEEQKVPLRVLRIVDFDSTLELKKVELEGRYDVEYSLNSEEGQEGTLASIRQFHGLPTADFRS